MAKKAPPPGRAAIYCRISEDRTDEEAGVKRQRADCVKYAAGRGWEVVSHYVDNDVSASSYSKKPRTAYRDMLAAVQRGDVNVILAYHLDRLYRRPRELEELIDLADRVTVATLHGELDLTTGDGRAMARVLVAMAAKSSDDTSRRVRRLHESLAEQGERHGGYRPFGFQAETIVTPDGRERVRVIPKVDRAEANAIRAAVRRVLSGGSLNGTARDWNEKGLVTPQSGGEWGAGTVRAVLANPGIAGLRKHQGEVVGDAKWPAIITRAEHEQLVALFAGRRLENSRSRYAFAGLMRCGLCGERLTRDYTRARTPSLRCRSGPGRPNCGRMATSAATDVEGDVIEAMLQRLDGGALARVLRDEETDDDTAAAANELSVLDERMAELGEMFASGEIDRAAHLRARRRLETERDVARAAVSRARRTTALDPYAKAGSLRRAWPRLAADEQRAILRAVIDRITLDPVPNGQPGVTVEWRA